MRRIAVGSPEAARIDVAMGAWRQGDLALSEDMFVHLGDPNRALTEATAACEGEGVTVVPATVRGLVIVTQTCDIVRPCLDRPFVEVSPLVGLEAHEHQDVERARRPRHAWVQAVSEQRLVADLDRTMVVEKAIAADWVRTPGWTTDQECRAFAAALARKRRRFAFPDDFVAWTRKLEDRIVQRHGKRSEEGDALRALREIRVTASPSWSAAVVKISIWFVREEGALAFQGKTWDVHLDEWLVLAQPADRFADVDGVVVTLGDMTAAEYVESDPLDLDRLSASPRGSG